MAIALDKGSAFIMNVVKKEIVKVMYKWRPGDDQRAQLGIDIDYGCFMEGGDSILSVFHCELLCVSDPTKQALSLNKPYDLTGCAESCALSLHFVKVYPQILAC